MLEIQDNRVSWDPAVAFPDVPMECVSGYQYSIEGADTMSVTMASFPLDENFIDTQSCSDANNRTLSIQPIVRVMDSILNNVNLTGTICYRGNLTQCCPQNFFFLRVGALTK